MNNKTFDHISLLELVGGRVTLEKVHKIFYDKIYAHNWLGPYFHDIGQNVIEIQQTEFMMGVMGGPKIYCGKIPKRAHKHMMITQELFDIRQILLEESLTEVGVDEELKKSWLKIDAAFKSAVVKNDISECDKRFKTDKILDFKNPHSFKKAA